MYGAVGQYVRVYEYAWAQGHTQGNEDSISIEMANLTYSPTWEVRPVTWREAARLCGFLHAKHIGVRPTRTTVRVHKDWKATTCAGPYIDTVLNTMVEDAAISYDYFTTVTPPPPDPEPEPEEPPPPPPPPPDPVYEVGPVVRPPDPAAPTPWVPPSEPLWVPTPGLPVATVAQDVMAGRWGGRATLGTKLRQQGYNTEAVRLEILELLHNSGELRMFQQRYGL